MRRLKSFAILFICLASFGFSQEESECGTTVSKKDIDYINSKLSEKLSLSNLNQRALEAESEKFIAITPHVVRRSDGTGGLAENQLLDAIVYLNETYDAMNMTFFIIGDINYINSDDFYDFDSSLENQITGVHNVANTINIYFYNTLSSGSSSLCGYAYFPSTGRDHVMMANGCTVNRGSTLPHELGHYFNLYHTHGKTNTGTTDELVDGSNCQTAGDDLCDTAADPNLSGKVTGDCSYTGSDRDSNGILFSPNPRNFMSYAPGQCRELFSSDQGGRILDAYNTFKTYLIDKYYAADFSANGRRVCEGESIQFVDESIAASTISWEFPGGSPSTSTDKFPLVSYANAGSYDVNLSIVTESGDTETKTLSNYVTVVDNGVGVASSIGSFESLSLNEEIINDDLGVTFEVTNSAASDGTNSVKVDFSNYSTIGAEDFLIAGKLATTSNKQFEVNFDYAYARYDDEFFDGLAIVMKNSCGEWSEVWEKTGSDLATAEDHTSSFIPLADEWQNVSFIVQVPADFDNTEIAFKSINGFGNSLYLDNYSITPTSAAFAIESVNITNASCAELEDGMISVTTSGAENLEYSLDGETFQSSNTFNNLAPGEYIVSAKEVGGGSSVISIGVIGPKPIEYTVNAVNPSCNADATGSLGFLVEGGTGELEINFNNQGFASDLSFDGLSVGIYPFEIQDANGCTQNGAVSISAANINPTRPRITVFSSILSIQVDSDVTAIQWYLNGEPIEGATKATLANPATGEYTVEVFNEFCSSVSDAYIVLATDEVIASISLYPNPVIDFLTIDIPEKHSKEISNMELVDISGRIVLNINLKEKINLSGLSKGIYLLKINTKDGVYARKLIKE